MLSTQKWSQSTEALVMGLNSLQKKICWERGWGGVQLEKCWRGATLTARDQPGPQHPVLSTGTVKSSITQMQVLVGSGLRSVPPTSVWAQGRVGGGMKPFLSCNNLAKLAFLRLA